MESRDAVSPHGALRLPPLFVVAVASVAVSVVVFLAMVASAACGSESSPAPGTVGYITATHTATTEPTATHTATRTPQPAATATNTASATATTPAGGGGGANGGGSTDTSPLVACNDLLAPVDKQHRLAENCAPTGLADLPGSATNGTDQSLRSDARAAILELFDAATKAGFDLAVVSSYRSYSNQVATYNYWVQTQGQEQADRTSARPGHSEHQLGTTVDISSAAVGWDLQEVFGTTPEGKWVAENSWKYGFIVSYPAGKESVTGYAYEPWHLRFVGKSEASAVRQSGLTLHEYLLRR